MYYFFIGPVLLPVTPEALTVSIGGNNEVINLINDSEINVLHDPKLKEAAFDVLLPTGSKYPFAFYGLGGAEATAFSEYFMLLQQRKIPFPFIVAKLKPGSILPTGYSYMQAVIEDYTQKEDAGNGLDVIVNLKLREYREYATIRVDAETDENGKLVYKATKQRGKSFTSEISALIKEVGGEIEAISKKVGAVFGL